MQTETDAAAPGTALRAGLATATTGAVSVSLLSALRAMLDGAAGPATAPTGAGLRVDELVGLAVVAVGVVAGAVLTVGCLLLLVAALAPGRWATLLARWAGRLTPAVLRRTVAVGLGTGLGLLGPVGLAGATEIDLGWAVTTPAGDVQEPPAGPVAVPLTGPITGPAAGPVTGPAAPAEPAADGLDVGAAPATPAMSTPGRASETVVVAPGDSLWSIAAAHLAPGAGDGEIAAAWPRWYATNEALVGEDPGLILPGQVLLVPAATAAPVTS